jgi:drug/metabolite transporter (DMT)-like permease
MAHNHHKDILITGEKWITIFLILLGWTSFSVGDVGVKILAKDYTIWQIMATTSGFSILILGSWIYFKHGLKGFIPHNKGWYFLRTLIVACTALSVVNALPYIPLADFYGITFAAPFLILILASLFLKEKVGWHRWLAVCIGFAGVIILAGPKFASFNTGYILALSALFFIAVGTIVLRKVGSKDPLPLYGFFPFVAIFMIVFPLSIPNFQAPPIEHYWLFALQIISIIGGQIFIAFAIASAKETASMAPFVYIQIIWGTLFGYFIFGDALSNESLYGLPLIIGAGLYMIYRERQVRSLKVKKK